MKLKALICSVLVVVATCAVFAQTTEFTYQGSLKNSAAVATGNFDFEFLLYDASTGGAQIGSTITTTAVAVSNGTFAVNLDFGSNYPGANRFLEVRVRQTGGGGFTPLTPRQSVGSSPYSVKSLSADTATNATTAINATNAVNATTAATATNALQLGGVAANQYVLTGDPRLSDARTPTAGSTNYLQNTTSQQVASNFNISGNGTAVGTISGGIVNSTSQYNLKNFRFLSDGFGSNVGFGLNVFVGYGAGQNSTNSGTQNVFVGNNAGKANLGGFDNTYVGDSSGLSSQNAQKNTFVGKYAGLFNLNGTNNSFFGQRAGYNNLDAGANSFYGSESGFLNTSGEFNAFFGTSSGNTNTTGSRNTLIGQSANVGSNNLTNASAIGANAQVDANNSLVLGSISGLNGASSNTNIGIGTPSPNTALHLRSGSTTGFAIQMENTSTVKRLYIGNYGTTGAGNHWPGLDSSNTSFLYAENPLIFTTPGGIYFSGSTAAEHMRISPNGNIGIGTINPLEKLHVSGRAIFNVPGNNGFRITPGTDTDIGVLNVTNAANTVNWFTVGSNGQVIMNGSGNVGIGTTSPTVKLQVGNPATSGGLTTLRVYGVGEFVHAVKLDSVLLFASGVRSICVDLSGFITECSSSSLRYKSDIGRFRSGLDVINVLRPITFRWKSDGSSDFGLAAEEVEKAMPGLVYRNKDGQVDGVRYDRIGVVLINAVKEQQSQIEAQRLVIDQLIKKVAELDDLKAYICGQKPDAQICKPKQ